MEFLFFFGGFGWLVVLIISVIAAFTERKAVWSVGLTRAEVITCAFLLPILGWWALWRVHQHDKRHLRRLEEEQLDRELKRLEG